MSRVEVRKRFELRARDEHDLKCRLETLREAIGARSGVIVDVRRIGRQDSGSPAATVIYRLPIAMGKPTSQRAESQKNAAC